MRSSQSKGSGPRQQNQSKASSGRSSQSQNRAGSQAGRGRGRACSHPQGASSGSLGGGAQRTPPGNPATSVTPPNLRGQSLSFYGRPSRPQGYSHQSGDGKPSVDGGAQRNPPGNPATSVTPPTLQRQSYSHRSGDGNTQKKSHTSLRPVAEGTQFQSGSQIRRGPDKPRHQERSSGTLPGPCQQRVPLKNTQLTQSVNTNEKQTGKSKDKLQKEFPARGPPHPSSGGGPQRRSESRRSQAAEAVNLQSQRKTQLHSRRQYTTVSHPQGEHRGKKPTIADFRNTQDSLARSFGRGAGARGRAQRSINHFNRQFPFEKPAGFVAHGKFHNTTWNHQSRQWRTQTNDIQLKSSYRTDNQQNWSYIYRPLKDSLTETDFDFSLYCKNQLDLHALEKIEKLGATEILMNLVAPGSGFKELLNKEDNSSTLTTVIFDIVNKACSSQIYKENIRYLLMTMKDSLFLTRTLPKFVMDLGREDEHIKREQSISKLNQIVAFYLLLLEEFPCRVNDVSLCAALLQNEYQHLHSKGLIISEESNDRLKKLLKVIAYLKEKNPEGIIKSDGHTFEKIDQHDSDVGNWRSMSILPTCKEVTMTQSSSVSGKFKDSKTYLDSLFHLLRESFVKPLRDRITRLLKYDKKGCCQGRVDSSLCSHVYFDVHIASPIYTSKGIMYKVRFDPKNLQLVNLESSKELMYGTLLCFSKDGFDTIIFATICSQAMNELTQGILTLCFPEESRAGMVDITPLDVFTMVDATVVFEDYRPLLESLQEVEEQILPMQKYIVSCETDISTPKYLLNHLQHYSLQALISDSPVKGEVSGFGREGINENGGQEYRKNALSQKHFQSILNFSEWPRKEEMNLDDSQLKAVQLALTKELAVIEGQAGTGKTYVGLKIVRAFLDNSHHWGTGSESLVLVLCHTDYTLDKFLEGVLQFLPGASGLVRVGGQSSSGSLKSVSLENQRREIPFRKSLPVHLRLMHKQLYVEKRITEEELRKAAYLLECSSKGIVHETVLTKYIVALHGISLGNVEPGGPYSPHETKSQSIMMEWLGVSILRSSSRQGDTDDFGDEDLKVAGPGDNEMDPAFSTTTETAEDDTVDAYSDSAGESLSVTSGSSETEDRPESEEEVVLSRPSSGMEEQDEHEADTLEQETLEDTGWADFSEIDPECLYLSDDEEDYSYCGSGTEDCDVAISSDQDLGFPASFAARVSKRFSPVEPLKDGAGEPQSVEGDEFGHVETADTQEGIQSTWRGLTDACGTDLAYVLSDRVEEETTCTGGVDMSSDIKRNLEMVVRQELHEVEHMLEVDARQICDLWTLTYKQRWHLYRLWLSMYQKDLTATILELETERQAVVKRAVELSWLEDRIILKRARLIGMTAASAVHHWRVLREIQPRVVLVEEAAEVGEAQIVTSVTSACQHLVLIGEQRQSCSRPSENKQTLNVGLSLYERLILTDVPFVRLKQQHRMHPGISQVLMPHLFDGLENHNAVNEKIKGVTTNIFFVYHKHLDEITNDGQSHQNVHEATFVTSFCRHLIYQGYETSQITVLTPYTGQLILLMKTMQKSVLQGVNVCLVDKYQGRENDIILLSLVRSSLDGKAINMTSPKYISIALSRAKIGLYCFGNMAIYSAVPLWSKILNVASSYGLTGEALSLQCENHPGTITTVAKADDFLMVPLGGCSQPCGYRLLCSHICTEPCHPKNTHHTCAYSCSAEGVPCQQLTPENLSASAPEDKDHDKFIHRVPCDRRLPCCGHLCDRVRGELCTSKCFKTVMVDLKCGHQRSVPCHMKLEREIRGEVIPCTSRCEVQMICSHQCSGRCGEDCVPCSKPCANRCYHQKCARLCLEVCQPCLNSCGWHCRHHNCTKLCHEPCDRPACHMPCRKLLKCQHPCIGMCGEPCPRKCGICDVDEVQELFFGSEADPGARFVQLVDCGHLFEVTAFDSWMALPEESRVLTFKSCPKCHTPIHRNLRYNCIIKRKLQDLEMVKRKATAMLSAQILNTVKAMEKKGIMSIFIHPLLPKLNGLDLDVGKCWLISKQIGLVFQLAEIENKMQQSVPDHLPKIKYQLDMLSEQISQIEEKLLPDYEKEVKRILYLAESHMLSRRYEKMSYFALTASRDSTELGVIISKLSMMSLKEQQVQKLGKDLSDIADKLKIPLNGNFLEETSKIATEFGFLKLSNWSKCSHGHVYYNQSIGDVAEAGRCDECFKM
ncbi:NFX1-type zinc finger-containing protein 1-like isoform X2 [Paramormyrops kingsleyae]|uniref:NFX1-type zinc finger-containing protein 1-like isoform X2 n=1 Tax=Paramormyrops kingsleyae TaxID=1676925 RepID=UPI003B96F73A